LLAQPGVTGATGNIYCGLHECHDMGFVLHFLREGDFFLDVGANIGSYTVLASGAVGAETLCFEPVPETFQHLLDNIHLNRLTDRVQAHNVAVGSEAGEIEMIADQDTVNRVITGEAYAGATVKVPVVVLDEILAGRVPKLIKIDVEGFELKVLQGMRDTLRDQRPRLFIEIHGADLKAKLDNIRQVGSFLLDLGYKIEHVESRQNITLDNIDEAREGHIYCTNQHDGVASRN